MKTNAAFQLWNALTQETVSDDSARTLPLGFVALGSDVPLVAYRHPAHPPTPSASAVAKFLREWADALDWTVPVPVPARRNTAPAPSPNSTQVPRSSQFRMRE